MNTNISSNFFNINFFDNNDYYYNKKIFKKDDVLLNTNKFSSDKLLVSKQSKLNILFPIHKYINSYDIYKKNIEKNINGEIYIKIFIWNCQSLNLSYKLRKVKKDFIRNVIANTKVDIIYLIDVKNSKFNILSNGYKCYTDNRNVLYVNNNINDEFSVDNKNLLIKSDTLKIAFTYVIPNCKNSNIIKNFFDLSNKKYYVFGDFNCVSNNDIFKNQLNEFYGEDKLGVGLIGNRPKKFFSISAPSDHFAIFYDIKTVVNFSYPFKLKEISINNSKKEIKKILRGFDGDYRPKITFINSRNLYNDGENTLDHMLDDYMNYSNKKIFQKYNYLWKYNKREPFLGTKISDKIIDTFKPHLQATNFKKYDNCIIDNKLLTIDLETLSLKYTKSRALTNEYYALSSITDAISEYCNDLKLKYKKADLPLIDNFTIINVINLINKHKDFLRCNTFFLVKNQRLETFSDVRMIVIIPTFIKIYETLVYDECVKYLSEIINSHTQYQFGGVTHGSCYEAMFSLRNNFMLLDGKGMVAMDMAKGYDTVSIDILKREICKLNDERLKLILMNWCIMVANVDLDMNGVIVRRTRGIPMGLSLSPIIFTYYVHCCLLPFKKDFNKFTMYIDDLGVIIPKIMSGEDAFNFINNLIKRFAEYDLVINTKKTMLVTNDKDLIKFFINTFPIVQEDKYLGREIGIDDEGFLIADDRFYDKNFWRIKAIPNFNLLGIKRILFLTALDAKYRYRFMVWSCGSQYIRGSVFKSNWYFFKTNNDKYSYLQMVFVIFNIFRIFIDAGQVDALIDDLEKGIPKDLLQNKVIEKLSTGIDCIDKAINKIRINSKIFIDHKNKMLQAKKFLDGLFKQFKNNLLQDYLNDKKMQNIPTFDEIANLTKTKYYNNFMIVQNICFNHRSYDINKQILVFTILISFMDERVSKIYDWKNRMINIDDVTKLDFLSWNINPIVIPKNEKDNESWNKFITNNNMFLWKFLMFIIDFEKLKYNKKNIFKIIDKNIFRLLTTLEAIVNNNNLKNLTFYELEAVFKVKLNTLKDLADKFYQVVILDQGHLMEEDE